MERIDFVRDTLKTSLILVGGIALVAASIWMALRGDDVMDRGIGWVGGFFFGAATIKIFRSLLRGGPEFTFDSSGIRLQQSGIVMQWTEIEDFSVVKVRRAKFLALKFRNPEQFFARISSLQAKLARINNAVGWGHWQLSFSGITPGIDQAVRFAEQHRSG